MRRQSITSGMFFVAACLALLLIGLLLTARLIDAQAVTPTPPPANSTEALLLRLTTTLEQMSANDAQTINASVLLQGAINIIFFAGGLLFVWRGGLKPLYDTMKSDRDRADKAERLADSSAAAADVTRLQIAQTLERAAATLTGMSTKTDDEARMRAAAAQIVLDVNGHTDAQVGIVDGKLQKVAVTLEELKRDVVTKQALTDTIDPLVTKIDQALGFVHDLQQAQPSIAQPEIPPAAETKGASS